MAHWYHVRALPMINWAGLHKYADLLECLDVLPSIDIVMVINEGPWTPSITPAAEYHRQTCL
jgi:hypothetical protein